MTDVKVAIVTAGGSGMGADAARRLAADGFKVAILSSSGRGKALAEELGGAPDQHHVVRGDPVDSPVKEHAKGGRAHQHVGGRSLPGEVPGFGHTLMGLDTGELCEASVVALISPDMKCGRKCRIAAAFDVLTIVAPSTAMHDHLIPNLEIDHHYKQIVQQLTYNLLKKNQQNLN